MALMKKNKKSYEILMAHLKKLKKENPNFSLRALSQKLKISHVFLANVLSGKKTLPLKRFDAVCEALKIDEFDRVRIKKKLALEKNNFFDPDSSVVEKQSEVEDVLLPEGHLHLLRYWWNLAILELLTCFPNDGLAKSQILVRLPIEEFQLDITLNELFRLKLIYQKENKFFKSDEHLRLVTRGPNPMTRHFFKSALSLAQKALDSTDQISFENRLITTVSCAVNPAQIPKAKAKLAEALAEVRNILTEGECSEVFFLQAQMFNVLK